MEQERYRCDEGRMKERWTSGGQLREEVGCFFGELLGGTGHDAVFIGKLRAKD